MMRNAVLFSFTVQMAWVALGGLVAFLLGVFCLKRQGTLPDGRRAAGMALFAWLALPLCLLCAHGAYVLLDFVHLYDWLQAPWRLLDLGWGGFTVYGGLLGWVLAAALAARLLRAPLPALLDALAPAALMLLAFCRMGEGAAGQGFSLEMENPALCFFPLCVYDDWWEVWQLALFVPEALYALAVALTLALKKPREKGDTFALALFLSSAAQIWFESLRRDQYMRMGFIRTMQLLSALLASGLLIFWLLRARKGKKAMLLHLGVHLLCLGLILAMEFAVEYKIGFLEHFARETLSQPGHYAACYGTMLLAVLALSLNALRARRIKE